MRIIKVIRSFIIIFAIVFLLYVILTNSKYLWRGFGYTFCENIDNINVYSVVKDYNAGIINIKGNILETAGYYLDYVHHIQEDRLYIGIKCNKYYGEYSRYKDFSIQIPCQVNKIKKIYLVDWGNERAI